MAWEDEHTPKLREDTPEYVFNSAIHLILACLFIEISTTPGISPPNRNIGDTRIRPHHSLHSQTIRSSASDAR